MAGTEELLARLSQLEQGYYGDKEAERQKRFFDTYGERFSNNRGLGLAILNELDARGIDTSAADEAVQQILDTLRTECNEIINSIKVVQEQAIESAQKVEQVANVVSEAVANNPGADASGITPPEAMAQMPMPPEEQAPAPEEQVPPEEQAPAPEEQTPAPEEQAPAPEEQVTPEQTVSDERVKRVQGILSDARAKRIKAKASVEPKKQDTGFRPSAGMIEAASRGY